MSAPPEMLPYDPIVGIRRTMKWSESERKLIVENFQECQDILDYNRALYNADRASSSLWGGRNYVKVASIPNAEIERMMKRGMNVLGDPEARAKLLAMLSSSEYVNWRTAPGRLA